MSISQRLVRPEADGLDTSADFVEIRPLQSHEDFAACVRLQHLIWGESYNEAVPAVILKIVQKVGGVAVGAFDERGDLIGCVFGITGVDRGKVVHWSHMLAVVPSARNSGIGRRLKEYQRDLLLPLGVEVVYWTFDPLLAKNAHLNLTRLGAQVVEYVPDMYGRTGSSLHALGTDRFIVAWPIGSDQGMEGGSQALAGGPRPLEGRPPRTAGLPLTESEFFLETPVVNRAANGGPASPGQPLPDLPAVRIEIPTDIDAVRVGSLGLAQRWQASIRRAFLWYLGKGYSVRSFQRDIEDGRCHYLLMAPNC